MSNNYLCFFFILQLKELKRRFKKEQVDQASTQMSENTTKSKTETERAEMDGQNVRSLMNDTKWKRWRQSKEGMKPSSQAALKFSSCAPIQRQLVCLWCIYNQSVHNVKCLKRIKLQWNTWALQTVANMLCSKGSKQEKLMLGLLMCLIRNVFISWKGEQ